MKKLLDIIFPKKCINCGKNIDTWVCADCFEKIKYGKIEKIKKREIKYLISLFSYGEIREKMLKFKFNDDAYLYNYFVELIFKNKEICEKIQNIDLIIPVPMYYLKKWKRGYNQSELIAKGISKRLKIEMNDNILIKNKNTKTQSLLDAKDRRNNLNDCFQIKSGELLKNKKILLVDDIYTTGTTIQKCIDEIKKYDVDEMGVLVIAKN